MSSMAIRIWIAFNFLTVFFCSIFCSIFECFITSALLCGIKGVHGVQWVPVHSELLQPFCILMAHFASLAEAAIILPLLGNFVAVTSFPLSHLHPALFRNVLLPRQFMLLSSARPRLKDLQRQPICQMWHIHTYTHRCSCNALQHQYRNGRADWGGDTPTHSLSPHIRNARNWKWQNKIVKTVKICCSGYPHFSAERMLLDNNFNFTTPPPSGPCCMWYATCAGYLHQPGRTWNRFLACWHCKILISILMSNCRSV